MTQSSFVVILCTVGLFIHTQQAFAAKTSTIAERLKPVGQVHIKKLSKAKLVAKASATPLSGKEIYANNCTTCHQDGVAGAPKLGDAAEWDKRKKDKSIEGLVKNAIQGVGFMPPKGTCMDCSDADIEAAVKFMLGGKVEK